MPRYFFETDDGTTLVEDPTGLELPDREAARLYAQAALGDMADNLLPDGDSRCFVVRVRNVDGVGLYSARLTLSGEWHTDLGNSALRRTG